MATRRQSAHWKVLLLVDVLLLGAVSAAPIATVFNYTGQAQYFTVPAGVSSVNVALWGAGGGAGGGPPTGTIISCNYPFYPDRGGAGAFLAGSLAVRAGETLRIIIGMSGASGSILGTSSSQQVDSGCGGGGGFDPQSLQSGGGGGGRSAIQLLSGVDFVVAGGGGGGAAHSSNHGTESSGGGGAATWTGQSIGGTGYGGEGGSSGSNSIDFPPFAGLGSVWGGGVGQLSCGGGGGQIGCGLYGLPADTLGCCGMNGGGPAGGGGGGGFYGGGGGAGMGNFDNGGAGGGGSSFPYNLYDSYGEDGLGDTPGGTSALHYIPGVGVGASPGAPAGGPGLVVITYDLATQPTPTPTPTPLPSGTYVFNYTGTLQTFTVPPGVTNITVTLWGGGGGMAWPGSGRTAYGGAGGAFLSGTLAVTPGETLYLVVGSPGAAAMSVGAGNGSGVAQGCGGAGGFGPKSRAGGGGGGGRSSIQRTVGIDVIAVGGGGGGCGGSNCLGGGGAAAWSGIASNRGGAGWGGGGANSSAGGAAGGSNRTGGASDGTAGNISCGGTGGSGFAEYTVMGGGGGGGGYYGGGGGGSIWNPAIQDYSGGGGGGGSSLISALAGAVGEDGNGANAGGMTSPLYRVGVGVGSTWLATAGRAGMVVIVVSPPAGILASAVRVSHNLSNTQPMALAEVEVWDTAGVNVARSGFAFASSSLTTNAYDPNDPAYSGNTPPYWFQPQNINNGVLYSGNGTVCEPWNMWHANSGTAPMDSCPWLTVNFQTIADVTGISVYLRFDDGTCGCVNCCTDRDLGDVVQLLDANGTVVWNSTINGYTTVPSADGPLPIWNATVSTVGATGPLLSFCAPSGSITATPPVTASIMPSPLPPACASSTATPTPTSSLSSASPTFAPTPSPSGSSAPFMTTAYPTATLTETPTSTSIAMPFTSSPTLTATPSMPAQYCSSSELLITTIAGTGTPGYDFDGVAATSSMLNGPIDVAVDAVGNMFVGDQVNHRIRKISTNGIISTVAGTGTPGYNGDGIAATSAELAYPGGIAWDSVAGVLYISDWSNNLVRKVTADGFIFTVAGVYGASGCYNGDGIAATSAWLCDPNGVAVDSVGTIFIADSGNHRIRSVAAGYIYTYAGTGSAGYNGDGILALSALLNSPFDVLVDTGRILIADTNNQRIRAVLPNGSIVTIAGTGFTADSTTIPWHVGGYNGDGIPATFARLNAPCQICMNSDRAILIADTMNNRVRKVGSDGIITTIVGNGTCGFNGEGVPATAAWICDNPGVAVDASGNIYVAEQFNNRVRKVSYSSCSPSSTTSAPATPIPTLPSLSASLTSTASPAITATTSMRGSLTSWPSPTSSATWTPSLSSPATASPTGSTASPTRSLTASGSSTPSVACNCSQPVVAAAAVAVAPCGCSCTLLLAFLLLFLLLLPLSFAAGWYASRRYTKGHALMRQQPHHASSSSTSSISRGATLGVLSVSRSPTSRRTPLSQSASRHALVSGVFMDENPLQRHASGSMQPGSAVRGAVSPVLVGHPAENEHPSRHDESIAMHDDGPALEQAEEMQRDMGVAGECDATAVANQDILERELFHTSLIPAEEVVSQRLDLRRVDRHDLPRDRSTPGFTTRSRKALMVEPMRVRKG